MKDNEYQENRGREKTSYSGDKKFKCLDEVDKAAEMLGVAPESILNNVYNDKYPELYVRQSVFSKTWFVWLPAVFGFTAEEWQHEN